MTAVGHVLDPTHRLVFEPSRDDSRFIDAGSAVLSRKWVRAELKLPIQDLIEMVHGGCPLAHPHAGRLVGNASRCQSREHLTTWQSNSGLQLAFG